MDDRLRRRVGEFVQRLAALGTFVEIEDLTTGIGDEVGRQLARLEPSRRAEESAAAETHPCPECERASPVEEQLEPLIPRGRRGEIEYSEPVCRCTRCRVFFFPLAGELKRPVRETVTPQVMKKTVWAGTHGGSFGAAAESLKVLAETSLSLARQSRNPKKRRRRDRNIGDGKIERMDPDGRSDPDFQSVKSVDVSLHPEK